MVARPGASPSQTSFAASRVTSERSGFIALSSKFRARPLPGSKPPSRSDSNRKRRVASGPPAGSGSAEGLGVALGGRGAGEGGAGTAASESGVAAGVDDGTGVASPADAAAGTRVGWAVTCGGPDCARPGGERRGAAHAGRGDRCRRRDRGSSAAARHEQQQESRQRARQRAQGARRPAANLCPPEGGTVARGAARRAGPSGRRRARVSFSLRGRARQAGARRHATLRAQRVRRCTRRFRDRSTAVGLPDGLRSLSARSPLPPPPTGRFGGRVTAEHPGGGCTA